MKQTFADSFYFLALFNPRDAAHRVAVEASHTLQGGLLTTDFVLVEVADALSDPLNRVSCTNMLNEFRQSSLVEILPATRDLLDAGFRIYASRDDKGWSLTDCISFHVMQERNVRDALTGDHHFAQAGFAPLLPTL